MDLTHASEEEYCVQKFFEGRKGKKTSKYAQAIVVYLSKKYETDDQNPHIKKEDTGWVVCSKILNNVREDYPDIQDSTFYRLLRELKDNHIIERSGKNMKPHRPGRVPVYYRVPVIHMRAWFDSKEELINQMFRALDVVRVFGREYKASVNLLKKCHPNKSNSEIRYEIFKESKRLLDIEKRKK